MMKTHTGQLVPASVAASRLRRVIPEVERRFQERRAATEGEDVPCQLNVPALLDRLAEAMDHGELPELALPETRPPDMKLDPVQVQQLLDRALLEYHQLHRVLVESLDAREPLAQSDRFYLDDAFHGAVRRTARSYAALEGQLVSESDNRLNQFLAMIAHELRTPLSTISNALYLLENLSLSDQAARQVSVAARQTRHAARLVSDLMDLSRMARGKIELRREPVSFRRLAADAVESVRPLMDSFGHQFTARFSAEPLWIDADPIRVEQIINNLLTNAAKYTEPGGRIQLSVQRSGEHALLSVRDNGIGIDPQKLPRIFDLYEQFGLSETRSHGGLGIGLPLVKRLVELHGGTVHAQSEGLGKGSEFEVRLPLFNDRPAP